MSPCEGTIWLTPGVYVQAEAGGRESRNRDLERSSSSRMDPDIHRVLADGSRRISLHVVSLAGALSPCPATLSATTLDSVDACTPFAPVRSADLVASDRSTIAELCRQGLHSGYASVDVGRDAGVSSFFDAF